MLVNEPQQFVSLNVVRLLIPYDSNLMIRLFRKIRHQLLSEDRYSVYLLYASGEIILVVIGILFALQIDNWNENRVKRNTEQLLIGNLKQEISANLERLDEAMLYHSKSREGAKQILEFYSGVKSKENYQDVDSLMALIQWAWTYDPSMGALNSIKMSGHLNSVQNAELRAMITTYEDRINDAKEEGKLIQDLIVDKFIPSVNQYVSLYQRVRYLGDEYVVGPSSFSPDYDGLFKDRNLEGIIHYIFIWRLEELKEEEQLKLMMEKFINTLKEESKKKK